MPVLQARVSADDVLRFKTYAKKEGMTLSELIRLSVTEHIEKSKGTLEFGALRGKIRMAEDFADTPECFEDYL